VIPFRPRARGIVATGLALAASVALAAVLLTRPEAGRSLALAAGPVPAGGALAAHLAATPSGEPVDLGAGRALMILATLPVEGGGHCREVEVVDRTAGRLDLALACTRGAGWQVEVALSEPLPEAAAGGGFVPAGGAETAGLTPWLDRLGAGLALAPEAELQLIAAGWGG
jgi:hypothetical protein